MQIVPLAAVPNQTLTISLSEQFCTIRVYQRTSTNAVYLDLSVSDQLVMGGMVCHDREFACQV
jgi:hypothetical protein